MEVIDPFDDSEKRGRTSPLFNEQVYKQVIDLVANGNYIGTACLAAGITERTYYRWLSYGEEVENAIDSIDDEDAQEQLRDLIYTGEVDAARVTLYNISRMKLKACQFRHDVTKAAAQSEASAVLLVRQQMPQQWTAAMTFLERRFPTRWKRRMEVDDGTQTGAHGIDEQALLADPEATRLIHDALERVAKELPSGDASEPVDATVVDDDDAS